MTHSMQYGRDGYPRPYLGAFVGSCGYSAHQMDRATLDRLCVEAALRWDPFRALSRALPLAPHGWAGQFLARHRQRLQRL
jgi:hypothetical protein